MEFMPLINAPEVVKKFVRIVPHFTSFIVYCSNENVKRVSKSECNIDVFIFIQDLLNMKINFKFTDYVSKKTTQSCPNLSIISESWYADDNIVVRSFCRDKGKTTCGRLFINNRTWCHSVIIVRVHHRKFLITVIGVIMVISTRADFVVQMYLSSNHQFLDQLSNTSVRSRLCKLRVKKLSHPSESTQHRQNNSRETVAQHTNFLITVSRVIMVISTHANFTVISYPSFFPNTLHICGTYRPTKRQEEAMTRHCDPLRQSQDENTEAASTKCPMITISRNKIVIIKIKIHPLLHFRAMKLIGECSLHLMRAPLASHTNEPVQQRRSKSSEANSCKIVELISLITAIRVISTHAKLYLVYIASHPYASHIYTGKRLARLRDEMATHHAKPVYQRPFIESQTGNDPEDSLIKIRKGKVETQPQARESSGWYRGKVPDKNSDANAKLKADMTLKTRKENLKPRKTDKPKIQFIQGNLQKSQTGQIELNKRISQLNKEGKNFVCLVQEPYSSRSRVINQPNSVQKFAVRGLARAAIYINKNTPSWFIENLSTKDLVVVQTNIGEQDTLLVSAYMDIKNSTLETTDLINVLDFADTRGLGVIIGMDSNCHSTLFGPKQNQRGYLFDELIANNNLTIENIGHSPTYESRGNKTCIDVTLSRGLRQSIQDWTVDRGYNGSDHNYIKFSLHTETIIISKIWQWHKADWEVFRSEMEKLEYKLPEVLNQGCCEEMLARLYKNLNRSMRKAIPKSKPKLVDKNNL